MKKPKLNNIDKLFLSGKNFSLTESQYYNETQATLPKDFYYLKNKSALAKLAKQRGYKILLQEKTILFEKEN
ncbi:MAG: hypothetical protein E7382_02495 [Clostridiales bacterium]|nr:hypothetical protein [Clostridiales bacterium]